MNSARRKYSGATTIVVVPDGLAADRNGRAMNCPSFVYRAALDWVAVFARNHIIYLAPANDFDGELFEQEAGELYLRKKGVNAIAIPSTGQNGYIDTRGNARLLRRHLIEHSLWPLGPITLVSAEHHARRAKLCFERFGFEILDLISVGYKVPKNERIVSRLFYYRYPFLHKIYELVATALDALRTPRIRQNGIYE